MIFFLAFAAKKPGAATFYVVGARPARAAAGRLEELPSPRPAERPGEAVLGHNAVRSRYRLLHSRHTVSWLDSYNQKLQRNADGSVNIYIGPNAPSGHEHNWIPTAPGKTWFTMFRFYGPEKPLFDKSWTMSDIEETHERLLDNGRRAGRSGAEVLVEPSPTRRPARSCA
jgi:hypothetical protein